LEEDVIVTIIATGCTQNDTCASVKIPVTAQQGAPNQQTIKKEQLTDTKQNVLLKPAELHVQAESLEHKQLVESNQPKK
jgi:hypothetical protein